MIKLLLTISFISFSTIAMASLPAKDINYVNTQSDYNDEVSALVDAQNQQQYQQQIDALQKNNKQSSDYSNCPYCVHTN